MTKVIYAETPVSVHSAFCGNTAGRPLGLLIGEPLPVDSLRVWGKARGRQRGRGGVGRWHVIILPATGSPSFPRPKLDADPMPFNLKLIPPIRPLVIAKLLRDSQILMAPLKGCIRPSTGLWAHKGLIRPIRAL